MTIKSDLWIEKMAREHGMIEPFQAEQVRSGTISYGLSSYGYDMRVADEWKVFTNVYNTLVDPKHFDPRSFVDIKASSIDIPPNSFALARSVEYFRIPRRVLAIVLGKCLTGDTRVVDAATGAYIPIRDMTKETKTIGLDEQGLQVTSSYAVISQGIKEVFRLRLRSGREIRATANHPFLMGSGWTQLQDLKPGMRIASARSIPHTGNSFIPDWEAILLGLMISEGQCSTPGHSPTYTSADPRMIEVLQDCVRTGLGAELSYRGRYGYRVVNKRGRGGIMKKNYATAWLESYGLNVHAHEKFVPQAIFTAPKATIVRFLQALFSGDGSVYAMRSSFCVEYASSSRCLIDDVHHLLLRFGISATIRTKHPKNGKTAWVLTIHNCGQIKQFAAEIGFWPGSVKQKTLDMLMPHILLRQSQRSKGDTVPGELWGFARQLLGQRSYRSIGIMHTSGPDKMTYQQAETVISATHDAWISMLAHPDLLWDRVMSITPEGEEEVFDICVPELHNFVANGIVVHNSTYARCGLIVNVTPLEPAWEGFVTIEISNTTPLPARVYANEGVAQVLFMESDEDCRISYADKHGKYQGQTGVVPPRM